MASSRLDARKVDTYAHTLFEAALSEDRVFENLEPLQALANMTPEFLSVLEAMSGQGDLGMLPEVFEAYRDLVDGNRAAAGMHLPSRDALSDDLHALTDNGVIGVHVTTAVPLDDDLRQVIEGKCELDLGSKVFLIEHVDPSIIGGIIISVRGKHRDASVKAQLDSALRVMTQEDKEV